MGNNRHDVSQMFLMLLVGRSGTRTNGTFIPLMKTSFEKSKGAVTSFVANRDGYNS